MSKKKLFSVMNDDADLCVMVLADSKLAARNLVYDQVRSGAEIESLARLKEIAAEQGVSPFVLLKTDEMPEVNGLFLVND
jgi:hypothetical protein